MAKKKINTHWKLSALKKFIQFNGEINRYDNKAICSKYANNFEKHEVDYSVDELILKNLFGDLKSSRILSDLDGDYEILQTLSTNKVINTKLSKLLSNPTNLEQYQQQVPAKTSHNLKLTEELEPNITETFLTTIKQHHALFPQLARIQGSILKLDKVQESKQQAKELEHVIYNLTQNFKNQQVSASNTQNLTKARKQEEPNVNSYWLNKMNSLSDDYEIQQLIQKLGDSSEFFYDNS